MTLFVAAVAAIGCGGRESPEIPTDELGIQIFGVVGAGAVAVTATLTTRDDSGQLQQIALPEGDRLVAHVGGIETHLERIVTGSGLPAQTGELAGVEPAPGDRLEVALLRAAGTDAPSSSVPLPQPFDLIDPPATHARGESLTLAWETGEADTIRVLLDGPDCVAGAEVRFDEDLGTATLAIAAFDPTPTSPAGAPCTADLQVDRLRDGVADPAFGRGGRVEAVITRAIALEITPAAP